MKIIQLLDLGDCLKDVSLGLAEAEHIMNLRVLSR
jgi:hypothetical protein